MEQKYVGSSAVICKYAVNFILQRWTLQHRFRHTFHYGFLLPAFLYTWMAYCLRKRQHSLADMAAAF